MTVREFRALVKSTFPHVKVRVRTVSFMDLARASAKCLSVDGERSLAELMTINEWARDAGIVKDGNIRSYGDAMVQP